MTTTRTTATRKKLVVFCLVHDRSGSWEAIRNAWPPGPTSMDFLENECSRWRRRRGPLGCTLESRRATEPLPQRRDSATGAGGATGPAWWEWGMVDSIYRSRRILSLWVADGLRGRYHVFDSTGAFQKTVPRPVRAVKRRQHPLLWESAGILIDETVTISEPTKVLYLRVDTLGHVTDTAAMIPTPERPRAFRNLIFRRSWESLRFVRTHYQLSLAIRLSRSFPGLSMCPTWCARR